MPNPSEFSRIRHDLRTPVNHILGYTEMLLEDEELPAAYHTDLQHMHSGGRTLLALINDYFDDEHFTEKRPHTHRMYHELRTPVNHIIGYAEMLMEMAEEDALGHLQADLQKIHHAANHWLKRMEEYLLRPDEPSEAKVDLEAKKDVSEPLAQSAGLKGRVLVVDDDAPNRELAARRLARMGHEVETASDGPAALAALRQGSFDAVLLDVVMPDMDGYEVLTKIKSDPALSEICVIMLSGLDEEKGVARCIEAGADDYLAKPLNAVFLRARLGACLEKKAIRDREKLYLAQIQSEQEKSDKLLLNILPVSIAQRLKNGESMIADHFEHASVCFADLMGFTQLSRTTTPLALVDLLNEIFSKFDAHAADLGLEKIKTIGDAYMVMAGVPTPRPDHAEATAHLALRMHAALAEINAARGTELRLRIGIHSGPVVAGIIGRNKFAYDVWGDTVNTASRMESTAAPDSIQISSVTAELLMGKFQLTERGPVQVKGIGEMITWTLLGTVS